MTRATNLLTHLSLLVLVTAVLAGLAEAQISVGGREVGDTTPQLPPDPTFVIEGVKPAQVQPTDGRIAFDVKWNIQHTAQLTPQQTRVDLAVLLSDGSTQTAFGVVSGPERSKELRVSKPAAGVLFNAATVKLHTTFTYRVPGSTTVRLVSAVLPQKP